MLEQPCSVGGSWHVIRLHVKACFRGRSAIATALNMGAGGTLLACHAGGLGDVMGALPKALARRGHRVMVVVPRYSNYEEGWETGVRARFRVSGSDTEVGTPSLPVVA